MTITFTRSGGLVSAPALRVTAIVTFEAAQAIVTADPDYQRELGTDERELVLQAASAILHGGSGTPSPAATPVRDAYQFAFTIQDDGREITMTTTAEAAANEPARQLAEWAEREAAGVIRARSRR